MNIDHLLEIIDHHLVEKQNRPLNSPEILILEGVWQYKTYCQIAIEAGYSPGYFTNIVAPELYQRLSKLIGQRITKKNCQKLLETYVMAVEKVLQADSQKQLPNDATKIDRSFAPCYPSGSVPLDSPFYLKRPFFEEQVNQEVQKAGALIRIKAPKEMGKTSLLLRIIDYANRLRYTTVSLNLEQVDREILKDSNQLLRWLCANVAHQLKLEPRLDDYWDEDMGSKISSTLYFQDYILEQINTPFVLALDEVNQIFEHPQSAKDFLPLLRSWYEEAKRLFIWEKLRLIVVHSTEIYVPLQLNQSPFNVGLPIQLNNFSQEEVKKLAKCYGIDWTNGTEAEKLMSMVEGHPALVHLALYHISQENITLSQLLKTAHTSSGIYAHHLQRHCATLAEQPELVEALDNVFNENKPVSLNPILTYKLSSMGIIKQFNNKAIASCKLYRLYWQSRIKELRQSQKYITVL